MGEIMSDFTMRDESTGTATVRDDETTDFNSESADVQNTLAESFDARETDPIIDAPTGIDTIEMPAMEEGTSDWESETPEPVTALSASADTATGNDESSSFHMSDIKQSASDAASQAKAQASQVISQAKDAAGQALTQAKDQLRTRLGDQKDRAADSLGTLTSTVHQVGGTFRDNNLPQVAVAADSLADQVDRVSGYLKNSDIDDLARDAEKFARENPAIVIAGALVLGLMIGRFLRSSGRNSSTALTVNGDRGLLPASSTNGNFSTSPTRLAGPSSDEFAVGHKPLTANGYVPGGVLGGAPA
jgi:hypothetical protein